MMFVDTRVKFMTIEHITKIKMSKEARHGEKSCRFRPDSPKIDTSGVIWVLRSMQMLNLRKSTSNSPTSVYWRDIEINIVKNFDVFSEMHLQTNVSKLIFPNPSELKLFPLFQIRLNLNYTLCNDFQWQRWKFNEFIAFGGRELAKNEIKVERELKKEVDGWIR